MKKLTKNKRSLQPIYKLKVEKDVYVTMSDGVRIAINVYRPNASGKFPALVGMGPYGKELMAMTRWLPRQPRTGPLWDGCIETGDSDLFVSRGYAHVIADSRGSGHSEGINGFYAQDYYDLKELIDWIAEQPWCDDNVGTLGISSFGTNSVLVSSLAPKALKAAWLSEFHSGYDTIYPGGVLCMFYYQLFYGFGGDSGIALNTETRKEWLNIPEEDRQKLKQIAENNPDIRNYPNLYHLCHYPEKNPYFARIMLHPYDGPFYQSWEARNKYHNIKCPVFLVGAWGLGSTTALEAWEGIKNVPKKLTIIRPGHQERPFCDHDEMLRWYDYHYKGIDNGIMDEPPIKLFITGINENHWENEWPLARTKWTKYYLRSYRRLLPEQETLNDVPPDGFIQPPLTVVWDTYSLKYNTPPMLSDTEVTGPITLNLYAKIDSDDTNWIVTLYDVSHSGERTKLSRGYLRASHRAIDEKKSTPYQPHHPHTKESIEVIKPGEIYQYAIAIPPIGHVFKKGHNMELEIKNMESPKDPIFLEASPGGHHLPIGKPVAHWIYQDKKYQSYLNLPIIPCSS